MSETAYFLSAVLGGDSATLEVRTKVFSTANLQAFLNDNPSAITFGPKGAWGPERLLEAFVGQRAFRTGSKSVKRAHLWRAYERGRNESIPSAVRSLDSSALGQQLETLRNAHHAAAAFVSESILDTEFMSVIDSVIADALAAPVGEQVAPFDNLEQANRQAVQAAKQELLMSIGTYSSEQLATACDSTTSNASQYAADLRTAGKIFGVRFGREWRYPTFQFDHSKKPVAPFDDVKPLLASLPPDERGWDRLQWLLQPNETLDGRVPLEVWPKDRAAVVAAAAAERWNGRD